MTVRRCGCLAANLYLQWCNCNWDEAPLSFLLASPYPVLDRIGYQFTVDWTKRVFEKFSAQTVFYTKTIECRRRALLPLSLSASPYKFVLIKLCHGWVKLIQLCLCPPVRLYHVEGHHQKVTAISYQPIGLIVFTEVKIDPSSEGHSLLTYTTNGGILDFYIFTGPSPMEVSNVIPVIPWHQ